MAKNQIEHQEETPIEEPVDQISTRRFHIPLPTINITPRRLAFMMLVILLLSCALLAYTTIEQPPTLWEPLKRLVNNGESISLLEEQRSSEDIWAQAFATGISNKSIVLDEAELAKIISEKIRKETSVVISDDKLQIFIDLDESVDSEPLWIIIDVVVNEEEKLVVEGVRTGLISAPSFFNNFITGLVQRFLETKSDGQSNLVYELIGLSSATKLKSIQFTEDQMTLLIDLNIRIEDLIPFI